MENLLWIKLNILETLNSYFSLIKYNLLLILNLFYLKEINIMV